MAVPEASVSEDDRPVLRKHKIRFSGEILGVESVAEPRLMQASSENEFRLGVASLYPRHHSATDVGCDDIRHGQPSSLE